MLFFIYMCDGQIQHTWGLFAFLFSLWIKLKMVTFHQVTPIKKMIQLVINCLMFACNSVSYCFSGAVVEPHETTALIRSSYIINRCRLTEASWSSYRVWLFVQSEIEFCYSWLPLCVQSSGKLEMERGMVKPMIRGEQQDSRSDKVPSTPPLLSFASSPSSSGLSLFSAQWFLLFSWYSFFSSGLRTFQQTDQSWLFPPALSSETTVSIYASLFCFPSSC